MRRLLLSRGVAVVVVTAALLGSVLASSASAHGDLAAGSPGPGDDVLPGGTVLQLEFASLDRDREAFVAVLGPGGDPIAVGRATIVGEEVVCARSTPLEPGVHTVAYSATATDGHRLTGRYTFEVSTSGTKSAPARCEESTLAAPGEPQTLVEMTTSTFPDWLVPLSVGLVLLAAGAVVLRVRRDRRRWSDSEDEAATS